MALELENESHQPVYLLHFLTIAIALSVLADSLQKQLS